jgi:glycosyltransferase involved in cell wall biosynthesis
VQFEKAFINMNQTPNPHLSAVPIEPPRDRLRILFISHAYVVGVNQGKLAAIAQLEGVEVGLLAPSNWQALEWNRSLPLERPYPSIQIYSAPVMFTGKVGAHFYAPWAIWRVLQDFKPDTIQVEAEVFSLCAFEVAMFARMTGTPLVVFGWENQLRQLPWARRQTCQFVLDTARAIIPGNQDGADIMKEWGYRGRLEVMPQMGVDPTFFAPPPLAAATATVRIGFLGRFAHIKGIDLLLTAVAKLRDRGIDSQVILCGSGSEEAALRQLAADLHIADRIVWRGAVPHDRAPAELSQFDVLVLPSRSTATWKEQFGHVLIEAMSMGIPVIGSNSGEIPHVIGRDDLVFPEEDAAALTEILARAVGDAQWRQEAGHYGLNRVHQLYTHDRIATRSIGLWQSILDRD